MLRCATSILSDQELEQLVYAEMQSMPQIHAAGIAVMVVNSKVVLTGYVPCYAEKAIVMGATENLPGVQRVFDELQVKPLPEHRHSDKELQQAISQALLWNVFVPQDKIHVSVSQGCVQLSGTVQHAYERSGAERMVSQIAGVCAIDNSIHVDGDEGNTVWQNHDNVCHTLVPYYHHERVRA